MKRQVKIEVVGKGLKEGWENSARCRLRSCALQIPLVASQDFVIPRLFLYFIPPPSLLRSLRHVVCRYYFEI